MIERCNVCGNRDLVDGHVCIDSLKARVRSLTVSRDNAIKRERSNLTELSVAYKKIIKLESKIKDSLS